MPPQNTRERIGRLVDKAENYHAWYGAPALWQVRAKSLAEGLHTLAKDLRQLYLDLGGKDHWPHLSSSLSPGGEGRGEGEKGHAKEEPTP